MNLKIISKNGAEQIVNVESGRAVKIPAQPGARYQFVDANGKPLAKFKARRKGSDLELTDEETGESVTLEGYYEQCAGGVCTLESADDGQLYVGEGGGTPATVDALASGEVANYALAPMGVTMGGIAAAVGGLALAAAGGGGGAAATATAAAVAQVASYVISGSVAAGPVVTGHGLTVTAYDTDGNVLGTSAVDTGGKYSITISTGYKGAVLIKVTDADTGTDYFDEATGAAKDLTVDLRALGSATGGDLTININPLTELAARKLGITTDAATASEADITATNIKLGELFGLGTGKNIVSETPVTVIKADGTADTTANAYGKLLALISGMEQNSGTGTDAVLTDIGGSLTGSGSTLAFVAAGANALKTQLTAAALTVEGAVTGVVNIVSQIAPMDPVISGATVAPLAWTNSAAAFSVAENGTTAFTGSAVATTSGAIVTYTLGGTDAALFSVSAAGVVTFASAPNYETPADSGANNVYDLTITATDNAATPNTLTKAVTVTVTNVNEAPVAPATLANQTAVNGQAFSYTVTGFTDQDAGDTLTYSASSLPPGLTISAAGVITGTATTDGTSAVTVTATDAAGLTATKTFNIAVMSAPAITAISHATSTVKSGDALSFTVTLSQAVTIGGTTGDFKLTLTVNGQAVTATYASGSGTNTLTFTATAPATGDGNAVSVTAITLGTATVTGSTTNLGLVTTTVGQSTTALTVDNALPVFTNAATASYAENGAAAAYAAAVTDASAVTYTLGGTDAALFDISSAGVVSFKASPNFEAPADGGADNVYDITVTATDAVGNATTQPVTVTVTNVNEAPVIGNLTEGTSIVKNAAAAFTVAQSLAPNSTVFTVVASDVDAGTMLSYSLSGADAAKFAINAAGVVKLLESPYKATQPSYALTVEVSDGAAIASQAVTVDVSVTALKPSATRLASLLLGNEGGAGEQVILVKAIAGQQLSSARVTGVGGDDRVYVAPGAVIDATRLGTQSASDTVYLSRNWADYTKSVNGLTLILTHTASGEQVAVSAGAAGGAGDDRLVFADGAVSTAAARAVLAAAADPNLVTSSDLAAAWNSGTTTPNLSTNPPRLNVDKTAGLQLSGQVDAATLSGWTSGTSQLTVEINGVSQAATYDNTGTATGKGVLDANGNWTVVFEAANLPVADGTYMITIKDKDGAVIDSRQVEIDDGINQTPSAVRAIGAQIAPTNQPFTLDVSGNFTDPDALSTTSGPGNLVYSLQGTPPAGMTINAASGVIGWTPGSPVSATSVTVRATDGANNTLFVEQVFSISALAAPTITSIAATSNNVNSAVAKSGDALVFTVTLSEGVTVGGSGTPTIDFEVGAVAFTATYSPGHASENLASGVLVFTATAPAGNDSSITVNSISLGGASVTGTTSAQGWLTSATGQAVTNFVIDNTPPAISSLAFGTTSGTLKIGDTLSMTITADAVGYTAGAITVNGKAATGFTDNGNNTYTVTYTVAAGDTDIADAAQIPVSVVLNDAAGNSNVAFTTAPAAIAAPAIDANVPVVSSLAFGTTSGTLKINDTLSMTITADAVGYTAGAITVNGKAITGFADNGNNTYTVTYTVAAGDTDIADAAQIPVSVVLNDAAGNSNIAFTTSPLATAAPAIDANAPVVSAVAFGATMGTLKINDTLSMTITADAVGYTAGAITVNGKAATGFTDNGNNTYTVTYTVATGDTDIADAAQIPVSVVLNDAAGNSNVAFTTSPLATAAPAIDANAPTVITTAFNLNENATTVATLAASESVTWALNGTANDNNLFALNSAGALSFIAAPNFEAPGSAVSSNAYTVNVNATDSAGNITAQALTVTVANINEAPVSNAAQTIGTRSVLANSAGGTSILKLTDVNDDAATTTNDVAFTDPDGSAPNNALSYTASLQGGGALPSWLEITSAGLIQVKSGETAPASAISLTITVTATDGGTPGLTATRDIAIEVASAPVLANLNLDGVTNLDVRSNIVLMAGENLAVTATDGVYDIAIVNDANDASKAGFRAEATNNTQTIRITVSGGAVTQVQTLVGDPANPTSTVTHTTIGEVLTISGGTVTINPRFDLDISNNYHVAVGANLFNGATSGLGNIALSGSTALNFSTVTPGVGSDPNSAVLSQTLTAAGTLEDSLYWLDVTNLGVLPSTQTSISALAQNYAFVSRDASTAGTTTGNFGSGTAGESAGDGIQIEGNYNVRLTGFGAGDVIYIDDAFNNPSQLNDLSSSTFGFGSGTAADPLNYTGGSTGTAGIGKYEIVLAAGLLTTNTVLANVVTDINSTTGMVISA